MDHLTQDPAFTATTFIVIDFETTTPAGHRPEPFEVAAVWLTVRDGTLARDNRSFQALICPPAHAPVTALDAHQTGITAAMTARQPDARQVLARLDAIACIGQVVLVAHNAPTEAGVLYDYRSACPHLAATRFLDTVRLARAAYPQLTSHSLDSLLTYLPILAPRGRHRAMPDTEATAALFTRILTDGPAEGSWRALADLRSAAGYQARAALPVQETLFPADSSQP
jgi:DNA polymerase III epsilon subunit-like protein